MPSRALPPRPGQTCLLATALLVALPVQGSVQAGMPRFENASKSLLINALVGGRTNHAAVTDLDGDGSIDLVLAVSNAPNSTIRWNTEQSRFEHARDVLSSSILHDSRRVLIADFTGDTKPDILFTSMGNFTHEYYVRTNAGYEGRSNALPTTAKTSAMLAFDIDGDNDIDLLLGNTGPDSVLINDGKGAFTEDMGRLPFRAETTSELILSDIDQDGDQDLLTISSKGARLLINDGTGHFTDETPERFPEDQEGCETSAGAVLDLDGDKAPDIFLAQRKPSDGTWRRFTILLNDGKGAFRASDTAPAGSDSHQPNAMTVSDIDGDGDPDLVIANSCAGSITTPVQILRNNRDATLTDVTSTTVPVLNRVSAGCVLVSDFNRDTIPDLYVCNLTGFDVLLVGK